MPILIFPLKEIRLQDYAQGRKTAGAFGQSAAFGTTPATTNIFGAPTQGPTQPTTSIFGNANTNTGTQPGTFGAFGQTNAQPAASTSGTGLFGAFNQPQQQPQQQQQQQPTGFGAFGQNPQQPAAQTGTGLFGAANAFNANKPNTFGTFGTGKYTTWSVRNHTLMSYQVAIRSALELLSVHKHNRRSNPLHKGLIFLGSPKRKGEVRSARLVVRHLCDRSVCHVDAHGSLQPTMPAINQGFSGQPSLLLNPTVPLVPSVSHKPHRANRHNHKVDCSVVLCLINKRRHNPSNPTSNPVVDVS